MSTILQKAKQFAIDAHTSINQKRKYSNEPYHVHCERVVKILGEITQDEDILAAAWMHDVLEDVAPKNPNYSEEKIRVIFGDRIASMVKDLTDSTEGNREARKASDRDRLLHASAEIKTIKLADLIDNFIDIQANDSHFIVVFAKETELLLTCLAGGNEILLKRLTAILRNYNDTKKN